MSIRKSCVAGKFYPGSKKEIERLLEEIYIKEKEGIKTELSKKEIIGGVVPHAGYIFSGYEAIHFFDIMRKTQKKTDTFIIINPSHTGYGPDIAFDENTKWETPLGIVDIDTDYIKENLFPVSAAAHSFEHSGEVILPMLQHFIPYSFKILPITLKNQSLKNAKEIANKIYETSIKLKRNVTIIASSDFSHYVKPEIGEYMDNFAVREILKLNSEKLAEEVATKDISMCGYGPVMVLIEYSKLSGGNIKSEILRKGNSGEVIPSNEVVDYISFLFYK